LRWKDRPYQEKKNAAAEKSSIVFDIYVAIYVATELQLPAIETNH